MSESLRVLYLEPWFAGSHAAFTEVLQAGVDAEWTNVTRPGRHWKWRMRGFPLWAAINARDALAATHDVVLASSYVALAELVGLVPELARVPTALYFHENQLAYPAQAGEVDPRDRHYGFTQLVSAAAADACWFNSVYCLDSFLELGNEWLTSMPDDRMPTWQDAVAAKSHVLPLPLDDRIAGVDEPVPAEIARDHAERAQGPILLWNHRWEHDKGPDILVDALAELRARRVPFRVAVCGERFRRVPSSFDRLATECADRLVQFGRLDAAADYRALLERAQVVVSTARHEFFGLGVLEAIARGCRPVVPDALVYPEHVPSGMRYPPGVDGLVAALEPLCTDWSRGAIDLRADRRELASRFAPSVVLPAWARALSDLAETAAG